MTRLGWMVLGAVLGWSVLVEAKDQEQGRGVGRGRRVEEQAPWKRAGERVTEEAVDAVVDELVGENQGPAGAAGMPPGLSKKGGLPPGLEKQGKVPPGWSKGQKTGWDRSRTAGKPEGFLRRIIKGVFQRPQGPKATSEPASSQ